MTARPPWTSCPRSRSAASPSLACTTCPWRGNRINISTPGHVDFTIEVEVPCGFGWRVGVFCAVAGVQPQSETVWRQAEIHGVPKLAFVNKMDRLGADFQAAVSAMRTILKAPVVALQIPVGAGQDFSGVIDLLTMEKLVFDQATQGERYDRLPLSATEAESAGPWRESLVEAVCEHDEVLLEDYLGGRDIALDRLRAAIRRAPLDRAMVPVLCGSALKNIGVQPLLDAVCDFLPSPEDRGGAVGVDPATGEPKTFPPSPDAPLAALVFKVSMETGRRHVFLRVYSGRLQPGRRCATPPATRTNARPGSFPCMPRTGKKSRPSRPAISFWRRACAMPGPAIRCATPPIRFCSKASPGTSRSFPWPWSRATWRSRTGSRKFWANCFRKTRPGPGARRGDRSDHPLGHGRTASGGRPGARSP